MTVRWYPKYRENPYRVVAGRKTKTWLPDDAGQFTDPAAPVDYRPWERRVELPDGRLIELTPMARGMYSTAEEGDDGWVYLFSRRRDPLKDILVGITRDPPDEPWAVHLPWVECIGTHELGKPVYRMPRYLPISGPDEGLVARLADAANASTDWTRIMSRAGRVLCLHPPKGLAVLLALKYLVGVLDERGVLDRCSPDFNANNMMADADGNIVLLDVIYWMAGAG